MARSRRYGEDLTYAEFHRNEFPELYGRVGHRIDMANRDWTEYCHYCKTPLALVEEVRDRGQDLRDKGVTVTRNVAARANLPAWLMSWSTDRPREVDREIEQLNTRIRELEARWPIVGFRVRNLRHRGAPIQQLTPEEWLQTVAIWHREHHHVCVKAHEYPVRPDGLLVAKDGNPLYAVDLLDILHFGEAA